LQLMGSYLCDTFYRSLYPIEYNESVSKLAIFEPISTLLEVNQDLKLFRGVPKLQVLLYFL
jgi:hypothetical protein